MPPASCWACWVSFERVPSEFFGVVILHSSVNSQLFCGTTTYSSNMRCVSCSINLCTRVRTDKHISYQYHSCSMLFHYELIFFVGKYYKITTKPTMLYGLGTTSSILSILLYKRKTSFGATLAMPILPLHQRGFHSYVIKK